VTSEASTAAVGGATPRREPEAANFHDCRIPMLMAGLLLNVIPNGYETMKPMHFARFEGDHFVPFGELMSFEKGR
jgi:hypothetical protein